MGDGKGGLLAIRGCGIYILGVVTEAANSGHRFVYLTKLTRTAIDQLARVFRTVSVMLNGKGHIDHLHVHRQGRCLGPGGPSSRMASTGAARSAFTDEHPTVSKCSLLLKDAKKPSMVVYGCRPQTFPSSNSLEMSTMEQRGL